MITAFVLAKVRHDSINETAEALLAVDGVTEVYSTAGAWDLVIVVRVRENEQLADVVTGSLLKTGGLLETTVPDHSAALTPPDNGCCESAEALALDLARTQRRIFTWADYDRLFAGMLRFADAAQSSPIQAILAPLMKRLAFWQKPLADGVPPGWAQAGELPALLLAQVWREM